MAFIGSVTGSFKAGRRATAFSIGGGGGGGGATGSPDISSSSFSDSFDTATQATEPKDLWFNDDGTKVFVADNSSNTIYRYGLSTGWDISTASYDSVSYSFSGTTTSLNGLTFNADGTSFYIMGNDQGGTTPDSIFQFDMSSAYDIANASLAGSGDTGDSGNLAVDSTPQKLMFNNDGTKLYIVGSANDTIYQYSLSSAYDITTISYDSVSFQIRTQTNNPRGMKFGYDGATLYVIDSEGTSPVALDVYTMSSAYDISTLSYDRTVAINASGIIRPEGLYLHPDGTSFYIQDGHATFATAEIYQYNTTALGWNPSTDLTAAIWFDASDISSYTLSGSNVTAVTDKAGNATVTVNGTPNVSTTLDSKNVFTFSGSGEDFTTNEVAQASSGNHWAIGVMQWNTRNDSQDSFWSTENNSGSITNKRDYAISAGASNFDGELDLDGLVSNRISSTIGNKQDFDSGIAQNTWVIIGAIFNKTGNQIAVRVNGLDKFTPVNDYDNSLDTDMDLRIFRNRANERMGGQMAEFFTVADVPGTGSTDITDFQKAEGYLAHKWGLEANLPVGHPYKSVAP